MKGKYTLNTIQEGIRDMKAGKVVIVVDDADRENEGDFIIPAQKVNTEIVNFMATHGRGLICVALTDERCEELGLDMMVANNTSLHATPFTVSVDLLGHGCTTGISASDRSKTIRALIDKKIKPNEFGKPGHIFPLRAQRGGVLNRAGHTEAAVDLARLAGMEPAGVLVEIMNTDGSMARMPELLEIAKKFKLKVISIADLIAYRLKSDSLINREVSVILPTMWGDFNLIAYHEKNTNKEHLALVKGKWKKNEPVLVRVHSSCLTGDIFGSFRCDCGPQLHKAMEIIEGEGKGVVLYMSQEGRGIGLVNKLRAYKLQERGFDTVQANIELGFKPDEREYGVGSQILKDLGITKMRLMSNNPTKRAGLKSFGLEIVENVPIEIKPNKYNKKYLKTKRDKMGNELKLE